MRYLVISDIHANIQALNAVLSAATKWDCVLMLGDVVGYGANPNAVIDRLCALPRITTVRGNHDKVAVGLELATGFNPVARHSISWTASVLTPKNRDWLKSLPPGPVTIEKILEICHGSPMDEDAYVFDDLSADRALRALRTPLCLFGHTHIPAAYHRHAGFTALDPPRGVAHTLLIDDGQYLINCGAVGQPRDGDPRAAFGLLDTATKTLEIRRVTYDVDGAQEEIAKAGLPEILARRLAMGR
jgi:diadenosine tetraphosphatase ApaH/serine/threonine PP2A family protein phosphatase